MKIFAADAVKLCLRLFLSVPCSSFLANAKWNVFETSLRFLIIYYFSSYFFCVSRHKPFTVKYVYVYFVRFIHAVSPHEISLVQINNHIFSNENLYKNEIANSNDRHYLVCVAYFWIIHNYFKSRQTYSTWTRWPFDPTRHRHRRVFVHRSLVLLFSIWYYCLGTESIELNATDRLYCIIYFFSFPYRRSTSVSYALCIYIVYNTILHAHSRRKCVRCMYWWWTWTHSQGHRRLGNALHVCTTHTDNVAAAMHTPR